MERVDIVIRDYNGNRDYIHCNWDDLCSHIYKCYEDRDALEILMISVDGMCIYSQLSHDPIDWSDVIGFFA